LVLPAVLVMRDGSTRILLATDEATHTLTVIDPSSVTGPQTQPIAAFDDNYLGYVFLARPAAAAENIVPVAAKAPVRQAPIQANLDVTERAKPAREDDDLQIPAFLRRQAN